MKKLSVQDWFVFGEWYDISWFHSCYFNGQFETIKERLGYGLSQVVGEVDGNVQRIYFSKSEWSEIGKRYLDEVLESPEKLEILLSDIKNASDALIDFSKHFKKIEIDNLSTDEQLEHLHNYHELHHSVWALGQVPNVLELENSYLTDYLKNWLKEKGLDEEEVINHFQTLVTPRELSGMQKEERDMLRLSQKEVSDEDIEKHCEKYSWIHFGWTGPSLDIAYFKGVCEGLHKEGESKETLEKILNKDKQLVIDKEKIIKDLEIDEHMQKLFRLLEEILYIKALRMDSLFISYEATQPLLKKIAKDNFLSLPQVYVLYYDWLIDMIKNNKIDAHKINKIAQYSSRYFDGEEDYLLVGDEARELVSQVRKNIPKEKKSDELKGECAFPGKVSGKVKIVNHADEMNKFEEGDILISYVTDPSLLPAMKKAKAFVTNTGGLTCHAAIVARELEVPCVIGTKIATKVLKDGDMVEVDATNGIVKKIK